MGAGLAPTTKSTVAGWVRDRWTSDEGDALSYSRPSGRQQRRWRRKSRSQPSSEESSLPRCYSWQGRSNRILSMEHTFVFENDYPALQANISDANPDGQATSDDLFQCHSARGVCKVICFHPNSKLTLPRMSLDGHPLMSVRTWIDVFEALARTYAWVQIFEKPRRHHGMLK